MKRGLSIGFKTIGMLTAMSMFGACFNPEYQRETGTAYIQKAKLEEHHIDKGAIPKPYVKKSKPTRKQRRKGRK